MAASKDDTKDTTTATTTKDTTTAAAPAPESKSEKDSKSLAGTYKLLRGSFSSVAPKDMKRDERLVPNGPLVSVSYKKGDRIRYDASDSNINTMELTAEQAGRFLFNQIGKKYDPPRVEKM